MVASTSNDGFESGGGIGARRLANTDDGIRYLLVIMVG